MVERGSATRCAGVVLHDTPALAGMPFQFGDWLPSAQIYVDTWLAGPCRLLVVGRSKFFCFIPRHLDLGHLTCNAVQRLGCAAKTVDLLLLAGALANLLYLK